MKTNCGTPHYAAPEVYRCERYGPSCDMWSLGVTVFALVTGHYPFFKEKNVSLKTSILRGEYNKNVLIKAGVSLQCRDFIARLIVVSPAGRMTAAQALEHPWLKSPVANTDLSASASKLEASMASLKELEQEEENDNDGGDVDDLNDEEDDGGDDVEMK